MNGGLEINKDTSDIVDEFLENELIKDIVEEDLNAAPIEINKEKNNEEQVEIINEEQVEKINEVQMEKVEDEENSNENLLVLCEDKPVEASKEITETQSDSSSESTSNKDENEDLNSETSNKDEKEELLTELTADEKKEELVSEPTSDKVENENSSPEAPQIDEAEKENSSLVDETKDSSLKVTDTIIETEHQVDLKETPINEEMTELPAQQNDEIVESNVDQVKNIEQDGKQEKPACTDVPFDAKETPKSFDIIKNEDDDDDDDENKMVIDESRDEESGEKPLKKEEDVDMVDDSESRDATTISCETDEKEDEKASAKDEKRIDEEQNEESEEPACIQLNFIKKFATSVGKLSRVELEELVLQKITESLVFRSKSSEYRTKYEKQQEITENLKQRLQALGKQYNDLEMIHKRIQKDLSDRPDQPVTPVKITRAVGLQVYQPGNAKTKMPSPPVSSSSVQSTGNKRPNEVDSCERDNDEIKRRKPSKKNVTPMRPPLSDREKASLDLQEASIEKSIRKKVSKSDMTIPNVTIKPVTNGNKIFP